MYLCWTWRMESSKLPRRASEAHSWQYLSFSVAKPFAPNYDECAHYTGQIARSRLKCTCVKIVGEQQFYLKLQEILILIFLGCRSSW